MVITPPTLLKKVPRGGAIQNLKRDPHLLKKVLGKA
jgi:hypothetical protein